MELAVFPSLSETNVICTSFHVTNIMELSKSVLPNDIFVL